MNLSGSVYGVHFPRVDANGSFSLHGRGNHFFNTLYYNFNI